MWKVKNFEPYERVEKRWCVTTADGQGRLKSVHHYANSFLKKEFDSIAYYEGDDIPEDIIPLINDISLVPRAIQTFGWFRSSDGIVTQILKKYILRTKGFKEAIITQFGTNQFYAEAPLTLLYDREEFMRLGRRQITKSALTSHQSLILARYIQADFDCGRAHQLIYGRELNSVDKYNFLYRVKNILETENGRDLFAKLFSSRFGKPMDFNDWRQKILDSIPDKLTKPFHLDMWMILGKLEPDVRKKLLESEGVEDNSKGSKFQLPQGVDAKFKDVCKYCNDTHIFRTEDLNGTLVEIKCPYCKEVEHIEPKENNIRV